MDFLQTQVADQAYSYLDKLKDMAIDYAPKIVGAIVVYLIGAWLISKLCVVLKRVIHAKNYDPSLQSFLLSLTRITLTILLLLTVVGMLGVQTTSFAAIIAGLAFGVGSALNGTLGNFAGGVMMLIFKPFKVGDMIEAQGQTGMVTEQGIVNTIVLTADNKTVIMPNGPLSTGVIVNYTRHGNLRVDLSIAIALDQSVDKARDIAIAAMLAHPDVLKTPEPEVSVQKVGDGMTMLAIRPYTVQAKYWNVYFGVQEAVKKAFDQHGIAAPVPTRIILSK